MSVKNNPTSVFLADECTFNRTIKLLRESGYKVHTLDDFNLLGAKDPVVFQKARELEAVLITNDQGFGDIRNYPPTSHTGIIVLKMTPDPEQIAGVHKVLEQLLETEDSFTETLFIVDHNKYRKRTTP